MKKNTLILSAEEWWKINEEEIKKSSAILFKHTSPMQVTHIKKIVLNSGVSQVTNNKQLLENTEKALQLIAQGRKPILTYARKSIINWKLRKGDPIGCKVTLRSKFAKDFLFLLINVYFPLISNFQGVSEKKFDREGNYTFGVDNLSFFPTVPYDLTFKNQGLQVTIVFKSTSKEENRHFLSLLNFPFKEKNTLKDLRG